MYTHERVILNTSLSASLALVADLAAFSPSVPVKIRRVFMVILGTDNNATAAVVKFDLQPTAGSASGRVVGYYGTLNKTASVNEQGIVHYVDDAGASGTQGAILLPGQRIIPNVTTANGATLTADIGIEYEYAPERPLNNANMKTP